MGINYTTWAIGVLAFGILGIAVNMSKKNKKEEVKAEGDVGGFGYEFDDGGSDGFDDLMDMNKKKE